MMDPVREVKVRAEILHKRVQAVEELERLRALPEFRKTDLDGLRAAAREIQRKHCLAVVARELGFASFDHARRVLEGDPEEADVGKLLSTGGGAHLNLWFATYAEARGVHAELSSAESRRYLLAYQKHFFITDRHFVEALGLDPEDADWEAIGWDWARPRDAEARRRLYAKLIASPARAHASPGTTRSGPSDGHP